VSQFNLVEGDEAIFGDTDTTQPPGTVCPLGEDEPSNQEETEPFDGFS
jgi:hypothetical protein